MDKTELDKLEKNIAKAIETIQRLHSENQRLRQENHNLIIRLREYERKIDHLKNQSQGNGDLSDQLANYKEREVKVKQKIQQMLNKLELLQQTSNSD